MMLANLPVATHLPIHRAHPVRHLRIIVTGVRLAGRGDVQVRGVVLAGVQEGVQGHTRGVVIKRGQDVA